MSNEVKQRKKAGTQSNKEVKDAQRSGTTPLQRAQDQLPGKALPHSTGNGSGSWCTDFRTVLCSLCLAVCAALIWTVYQHAENFTILEQKYQSLQSRSSALEELENKVGQIFGKLEETTQSMQKLRDLSSIEQLQNDIAKMERGMNDLSAKRAELEGRLTNLEQAIFLTKQDTATAIKDLSSKITTVKTDVRRISGMEDDVVSLTDMVSVVEKKLEKVEKNTAQSIGDALVSSIDRIASLKSSVSTNSDRIDLLKMRLKELRGNFTDNSDKLSSLETDRLKVLQAVHFANELKPKVSTLRKDFAGLETMISDLTLRIGRLASDILSREKDISLLSDKMYNLTVAETEIVGLNNKIGNV